MYYVRKLCIGVILNSKRGNKLVKFKKGSERMFYEIVTHVPIRKEVDWFLDNSNIILNAYTYLVLRKRTNFNMPDTSS